MGAADSEWGHLEQGGGQRQDEAPAAGAAPSVRLPCDASQATQRLPANFPLGAQQQLRALRGVLPDPDQGTEN